MTFWAAIKFWLARGMTPVLVLAGLVLLLMLAGCAFWCIAWAREGWRKIRGRRG
jgi:hypothetical protein